MSSVVMLRYKNVFFKLIRIIHDAISGHTLAASRGQKTSLARNWVSKELNTNKNKDETKCVFYRVSEKKCPFMRKYNLDKRTFFLDTWDIEIVHKIDKIKQFWK